LDILTLACLTSLVLAALGDPSRAPLHATDLVGLGRWLTKMGRQDAALEVYARALGAPLPPEAAARARWESAAIHKRNGDYEHALPLWRDLRTPEAAVEMAKYFEHRARNYSAAMLAAQEAHDEKRIRRLERKAAASGA
jgi:tetratricopeptide (TPR) repeat protein